MVIVKHICEHIRAVVAIPGAVLMQMIIGMKEKIFKLVQAILLIVIVKCIMIIHHRILRRLYQI